jgi:glycosyltransferase involved in cell wall biosynthesis
MNEAAPAPMTARPPGGEWPLVSVVVPAYNAEAYIVDCLRSILQQDYPALQVIVVDDGSTDATPERVQTLGAAVTYRRQPNSGSAVARNLGVALAEGEYVAFCDSDDLWAPHRLKQQVDFLRGQGKYHAVCGRFMAVPDTFGPDDAARQAYQAEPVLDPTKSGWTYLRLLETSIYHLDALLVRCEVVKAIRFNPDYRRGQDFDFFLQLVQATPIAQLDNLYAFYRQNPHSITRRPHVRNYRAEIIAAALQRWGRTDQMGREMPAAELDRLLATSWFGHGYELFRARWFRKATQSFRLALKHDPRRPAAYRYALMSWLRQVQDETPRHLLEH